MFPSSRCQAPVAGVSYPVLLFCTRHTSILRATHPPHYPNARRWCLVRRIWTRNSRPSCYSNVWVGCELCTELCATILELGCLLHTSHSVSINYICCFYLTCNLCCCYCRATSLDWGISVPLYPFYRAALILRVQSAGTHRIVNNPSDFLRMYRHDLSRFFGHGRIYPSSLPLTSLFTSSCALHIASEKMLMLLYKCIHRVFMHKTQRPSRHHHRRSRRQQLVEQQQQQILESANTFSDISARQNNNNNNNNRPLSPFYGTSGGSGKKEDTSMLRTFYPEIVSGMISSMVTRTLCYPFDSILFKLMLQDTGIQPIQTNYQGFWDCAARTYREEGGLRAFYPGWGGCVLEMIVSYLVLESAWAAYRVIEWKLSKYPYKEPRSVRKARKLQERMDGR